VDFTTCATIGRQVLYVTAYELRKLLAQDGHPLSLREIDGVFDAADTYAEPLLRIMGAKDVDSFDASTYEGATRIADFNEPLTDDQSMQYSVVIDGGSLEHVFNYAQGLKNAMELVRPGGHLILLTPTHSRSGHGFYQTSPELFFRALSEANGYEPPEVLVCHAIRDAWYRIPDPKEVGGRIILNPRKYDSELFVVAKRSRPTAIFTNWPQQSDYTTAWSRSRRKAGRLMDLKQSIRPFRHRIPRLFHTIRSLMTSGRRTGAAHVKRIEL
jgi:SAM-dependent methyltransferase